MEIRTLVALSATMICAAVAAHATSVVQTAREVETAPLPAGLDDAPRDVPESALARALAADGEAIQIQLRAADPEPRSASVLYLPLEVAPR